MRDFEKEATVLVDGVPVKLESFHKEKDVSWCCFCVIRVSPKWVTFGRAQRLWGISFVDGKLGLHLDERPRLRSDPQTLEWHECRPADEVSSKVLQELFEDKAYERRGFCAKRVQLVWPW